MHTVTPKVIKRGDKYPITLTVNMDLTGCTVRLLIRPRYDTAPGEELASTVTDAGGGVIQHTLTGTLEVGQYELEAEVTRGTEVVTFPTLDGDRWYELLEVVPDIA